MRGQRQRGQGNPSRLPHRRGGVVDVVPFVALDGSSPDDVLAARNEFATWATDELNLPVFLYGPERTLPDVRRGAWTTLMPDHGPDNPHPTAGAVCVGVRQMLIAYNVFLASPDLSLAKGIAARVRRPGLHTLAFLVGGGAQVSMNTVDPEEISVSGAYDAVAAEAAGAGTHVVRAEQVGLLTERHLRMSDKARWAQLDIGSDRTVESRLR
jgi:glutamate formiminotransferase